MRSRHLVSLCVVVAFVVLLQPSVASATTLAAETQRAYTVTATAASDSVTGPATYVAAFTDDIHCRSSGLARNNTVRAAIVTANPDAFWLGGDIPGSYAATDYTAATWGYDATIGSFLNSKTYAVPGNHDFDFNPAANPGFDTYFASTPGGTLATAQGHRYYVKEISVGSTTWRVYFLSIANQDSDTYSDATARGSAQYNWLEADLAAHPNQPIVAVMHGPRWSVAMEHPTSECDTYAAALYDLLYDAHADLTLCGHVHQYTRWPKMNKTGYTDANGIRQISGPTASQYGYAYNAASGPASGVSPEAYRADTGDYNNQIGYVRITLYEDHYAWAYYVTPTSGGSILTDSGSEDAHNVTTGTTPDTTAPSAPIWLIGTATRYDRVDLSWGPSVDDVGVVGYRVYRDGVLIGTTAAGVTSYIDRSVAANGTYAYQVRAYDAAGNSSELSGTATVTTPPYTPVAFSDDFESSALGAWTVSGNVTAQTTQVHAGSWAARAVSTGTAAYALHDLSDPLSDLYYRTWFKVVSRGSNAVYLARFRTAANGAVMGVYVTSSGTLAYRNDVAGAARTSSTTVTAGVWHELQVRAGVSAGQVAVWLDGSPVTALTRADAIGSTAIGRLLLGDNSSGRAFDVAFDDVVASAAYVDTRAPGVPSGLAAAAGSYDCVDLSWTAATDDVAVSGYHVYRDGTLLATVTGTSYSDRTVSAATTYSYKVRAFDAAGNASGLSAAATVTTPLPPDTTAPSAPAGLTATPATADRVDLGWTAASDDYGVAGYEVFRDGTLIGTATGTSYADHTVAASTTYSYQVRAFDAAGNVSALSDAAVAITPWADTTPPSVPADLVASAMSFERVDLTWSPATDDVGVIGYRLYRDGQLLVTATDTSYTDRGVAGSTTYSYAVQALDAAGNVSGLSAAAAVATPAAPDTASPSTPAGLIATAAADRVDLSWTAATDDVGVAGYELYRGGSLLATVTGTSYSDRAVSAATTYSYQVRAFDAAGNVFSALCGRYGDHPANTADLVRGRLRDRDQGGVDHDDRRVHRAVDPGPQRRLGGACQEHGHGGRCHQDARPAGTRPVLPGLVQGDQPQEQQRGESAQVQYRE